MVAAVKAIVSILIAMLIQGSVSGITETTPQEAADDFLSGIMSGDQQVIERHLDNDYVNFIANMKGDDELTARLPKALFKNFSYKVEETAVKGSVAVAKVRIKTNDFSDVMKGYEKESYEYVMKNLYSDKATDKKKLSAKCLEIYIEQIEKEAKNKAELEGEIFIPMREDGYGGWEILLSDDIMKIIIGELAMPE